MYIPERFQTKHGAMDLLETLVQDFPFATLVSSRNGDIFVSKLPIILFEGKIQGHLSVHNEHSSYLKDQGCRHRVLIDGPHGFISPRFLGSRPNDVPTWNYVSAVVDATHVSCIVDKRGISQILARQVRAYDGQDLSYLDSHEFVGIEKEIMGFSIPVSLETIAIKQKLSQNKSDEDFQLIIESLKKAGQDPLVAWMVQARNASGTR